MNIENVIAAFVTVLAIVLFVVSVQSYRRSKKKKILVISLAFLLFFVKGVVMSIALFHYIGLEAQISYLSMFDVIILFMLFVAVSVKK